MNTLLPFKSLYLVLTHLILNSFLFGQIISTSNSPPQTPKWVFEPWVWEDSINTQSSAWEVVNEYLNRDIPVSAVIIDSPWETGYNTFEFDPNRYPNPKQLIDDLSGLGIHTILWITGLIDSGNTAQWEHAKSMHYFVRKVNEPNNWAPCTNWWKGTNRASHIDFFNDQAVMYWKDTLMDKVFDEYNVDGWKVDQSDYYIRKGDLGDSLLTGDLIDSIKSLEEYSDAYYRHIYEYTYIKRGSDLAMITARPYCKQVNDEPFWYAAKDINTAGWVGDQFHNWEGLKLALKNIFISADSGYSVVGSDIGSYRNDKDERDSILFKRWLQMGALMPIMENGGQYDSYHFPWLYSSEIERIYKYYATLHHELVPYLNSYNIKAANYSGDQIVQPIGDGNEFDISNWEDDWRYFLGRDLFCAAIFNNSASRQITFPNDGEWINYWNEDEIYLSNDLQTISYDSDKYPIFIRSGAIIPMNVENNITSHGTVGSVDRLTILVYPNDSSSFTFYQTPTNSILIENFEYTDKDSIHISPSTEKFIFRIKLPYKPSSIKMNENYYISEVADSIEFNNSEEGWRYDSLNTYCWIKFSSNGLETNLKLSKSCFTNIHPSNYETSILNVGNEYYVDRTYTIINLPDEYKGLDMIKTANDDKNKDSLELDFRFDLNRDANIYIAYDHRLTPSSWLISEYTNTGKEIMVSDIYASPLKVWTKTALAGTIFLGSNATTNPESAMYFVFCKGLPSVKLKCKAFLQGPFENGKMFETLNQNNNIPLTQPFSSAPWFYEGEESVTQIPENVVDWILIELRNKSDNTLIKAKRAGFILSDGTIVDTNGSSPVQFFVEEDNYYIVLKHRNHLGVMSAESVLISN